MSARDTQSASTEVPEKKMDQPKAARKGLRRTLARALLVLAAAGGAWWYVSNLKPPLVIPEGGGESDWPA